MKGFSLKHIVCDIALKVDVNCYRSRKYTVCKCIRASFSPDIFQARAVKGLKAITVSLSLTHI